MSNIEHSAEHRPDLNTMANAIEHTFRTETSLDVPANNVGDLTDAEKLDYLYQVAVKVGALVDAISPAQVEQVKRMQTNPLISKLFAGIVKS